MYWGRFFAPCAWGVAGIGASAVVTAWPTGSASFERASEGRLLPLMALGGMLLGSFLLSAFGRRLSDTLDDWRRDPMEATPMPFSRTH